MHVAISNRTENRSPSRSRLRLDLDLRQRPTPPSWLRLNGLDSVPSTSFMSHGALCMRSTSFTCYLRLSLSLSPTLSLPTLVFTLLFITAPSNLCFVFDYKAKTAIDPEPELPTFEGADKQASGLRYRAERGSHTFDVKYDPAHAAISTTCRARHPVDRKSLNP